MGTFVDDTRVAAQLRAEYDRLASPGCSWRVSLAAGGALQWTDGVTTLRREPFASLGLRVLARVLRWLPIESKL